MEKLTKVLLFPVKLLLAALLFIFSPGWRKMFLNKVRSRASRAVSEDDRARVGESVVAVLQSGETKEVIE